jgi:uncharacterized protein YecT (DUF1311 family)
MMYWAVMSVCVAVFVGSPALSASQQPVASAQEALSFEPGGQEACAAAVHLPVPSKGSTPADAQTFVHACNQRDLAIEKMAFDRLRKTMEAAVPEQRIAFNALMVSFAGFREMRVAHESCTGGSRCAEIEAHETAMVNASFLTMANAKDGFPNYSAEDFAGEDASLNAEYETVLASLVSRCPADNADCKPAEALRGTQRAWIRYRDAWVTFATLRWPQVTAASWSGYLTHRRTQQIRDYFGPSVS